MSRNTRWGVPGNRADQPVKHSTLVVGRVATVAANADVTPTTVVAQAFIDTPSVTADANTTPTTVAAQTFVDTPSVTADANITPTTVVAQVFIDTPTVTADANITPTTVATTTTIDTPTVTAIRTVKLATAIHRPRPVKAPRLGSRLVRKARIGVVSADANVTPTTVVAQAFIDTPTVSGDAEVTPTTVVAQAFVDTPTVTADANVTPTTVVAQAFVDTPSVTGDANVTAGNVAATTTIDGVTVTATTKPKITVARDRARKVQGPQTKLLSRVIQGRTPVVSADANVTPDTVVATTFIDTPSVSVGRALKVLAAPDRKRKIQGPQLKLRSRVKQGFTGVLSADANVTAGDVAATVSIPTPGVEAGRVLGHTVVGLPAPKPVESRLGSRLVRNQQRNASVTPTTVVAQAFVDVPTVEATGDPNANVTTTVVVAEAFIPTPTVAGNADVTPTTVAAVVSIPTPDLATDVAITPTTVVATTTIPTPTIYATAPGDADVVPDTVVAVVNMDALPLVEPGGLIRHRGLIGYGFSNSSPFGNRRP